MSSKYYIWNSAYDDKITNIYRDSVDKWPFEGSNGWWRNDPLSNDSIIRPNIAGYYPYVQTYKETKSNHRADWEYAYEPVCSTRFPENPQYQKNKEIILYR